MYIIWTTKRMEIEDKTNEALLSKPIFVCSKDNVLNKRQRLT